MNRNRSISYGYKVVNGVLVPDEAESKVVNRIFTRYEAGFSLDDIARILMNEGIVNIRGDVKWDKARIKRILDNSRYIGEGNYPAIIDEDLFARCQKHKDKRRMKAQYKQLLNGLNIPVVCTSCGTRMNHTHRDRGIEHEYWGCKTCGHVIQFDDDVFVRKVSDVINYLTSNPEVIRCNSDYTDNPGVSKIQKRIETAMITGYEDVETLKKEVRELATIKFNQIDNNLYLTKKLGLTLDTVIDDSLGVIEALNIIGRRVLIGNKDELWIVLMNNLIAGKEYGYAQQGNADRTENRYGNSGEFKCIPLEVRSA